MQQKLARIKRRNFTRIAVAPTLIKFKINSLVDFITYHFLSGKLK